MGGCRVDSAICENYTRSRFTADNPHVLYGPIMLATDVSDAIELMFETGWTDGLPVVPPSEDLVRKIRGDYRARRATSSSRSCRLWAVGPPWSASRSTR